MDGWKEYRDKVGNRSCLILLREQENRRREEKRRETAKQGGKEWAGQLNEKRSK